jgi:hypothetical protein
VKGSNVEEHQNNFIVRHLGCEMCSLFRVRVGILRIRYGGEKRKTIICFV